MGKIDSETKEYVSRPEVFADLFNHLIYDGESVIKPDELSELDSTATFIPFDEQGKAFPVQKYRDVLKRAVVMEDNDAAYALILGAENQTDIHYAMPVRNMGYDAYNYAAQVALIARKNKKESGEDDSDVDFLSGLKREDKITPVITLVVYFGQKPWDGPRSIHEMLSTHKPGVLKFVPDYKMNLIAPISMEKSEIDKFTSNFRELATFIKCGSDKHAMRELVQNNEKFRHLDPLVANIVNDVTKSGLNIKPNEKGEVDMCIAIFEMQEDSKAEGRVEGRVEGRAEGEDRMAALMNILLKEKRYDDAQRATEDPAYRKQLMKELA